MQIDTPKTQSLVRLDRIADDINSKFNEAIKFAGESSRSGRSAVVAAIDCGKLLSKAKKAIGHGGWFKWLKDNCPDMSHDTAVRWMKLAKNADVRNLEDCTTLTRAYIATGSLPEPTKKENPIGTAEVNIFEQFVQQVSRECDKILELTKGLDLNTMPQEHKDEVRRGLAKVKELEGML